jgi:hypothetical protein
VVASPLDEIIECFALAQESEITLKILVVLSTLVLRCNPDIDDDWWKLARAEIGGDDFGRIAIQTTVVLCKSCKMSTTSKCPLPRSI